jgi:hypothetical protein
MKYKLGKIRKVDIKFKSAVHLKEGQKVKATLEKDIFRAVYALIFLFTF